VLKPAWAILQFSEKERLLPKVAQSLSDIELAMLLGGYCDKFGDQAVVGLVEFFQSRNAGKPEEMLKLLLPMVRGPPMVGKEGEEAMKR
jgi:hypothetical protein